MRTPRLLLALLLLAAAGAPSARAAERNRISLKVALNNPFNPYRGEATRFEYVVRGQDTPVRVIVFAADGHPVRRLADHLAAADAPNSVDWDGRSDDGGLVSSGVYFVVLDAGDGRKTARVAVRNR
jgi:hypothetical protein